MTKCRVSTSFCIAFKRTSTSGRVQGADGVIAERIPAAGRVIGASCVAKECVPTNCCVDAAGGIFVKRKKTVGYVALPCGVVKERLYTSRIVVATSCITF